MLPTRQRVSADDDVAAAELWVQLARYDAARDVGELARVIVLLLTRDQRVTSLADVERQLRASDLNTRLVACRSTARGSRFDGAQIRSPHKAHNHCCAYYLSINVEGDESAARQRAAHGAATAEANLQRLEADCGVLVAPSETKLENYDADLQLPDDTATRAFYALTQSQRWCCSCRRLQTRAVELRTLECCTHLYCCSTECWQRHVVAFHQPTAMTVPALDDEDEDEDGDDNDGDDEEKSGE